MSSLLMAAIFGAATATADLPEPTRGPAGLRVEHVQNGTLLFSQGDCLAVKIFSGGPYTHVAAVVLENRKPYVYDSMAGVGVRRQSLESYLRSLGPETIHVTHPRRRFNKKQVRTFHNHLQSQLGKPYAVKHHLTGQRSDGIHCAEYVTDALAACKLIRVKQPPRVSPSSLAQGILTGKLYAAPQSIVLARPVVARPKSKSRCVQLWFETKLCTNRFFSQMRGWFLCK